MAFGVLLLIRWLDGSRCVSLPFGHRDDETCLWSNTLRKPGD